MFEWLGARARARARAANAERVPVGMFSLIADSGVILFVSGVSNLIDPAICHAIAACRSIGYDYDEIGILDIFDDLWQVIKINVGSKATRPLWLLTEGK